jgi:hypothetical protein
MLGAQESERPVVPSRGWFGQVSSLIDKGPWSYLYLCVMKL